VGADVWAFVVVDRLLPSLRGDEAGLLYRCLLSIPFRLSITHYTSCIALAVWAVYDVRTYEPPLFFC
jgi:hypothetical protein